MNKYCFDSSAFINSWRRYYPPTVFSPLWEKFVELIKEGRIIIPKEAEKEILAGRDDLAEWLKINCQCVKKYTTEQLFLVQEIVNKYPKVSQYKKVKSYHADPFVLALAKIENASVVTYEANDGNYEDPKIPILCREYKVKCFDMVTFFNEEKFSFRLTTQLESLPNQALIK